MSRSASINAFATEGRDQSEAGLRSLDEARVTRLVLHAAVRIGVMSRFPPATPRSRRQATSRSGARGRYREAESQNPPADRSPPTPPRPAAAATADGGSPPPSAGSTSERWCIGSTVRSKTRGARPADLDAPAPSAGTAPASPPADSVAMTAGSGTRPSRPPPTRSSSGQGSREGRRPGARQGQPVASPRRAKRTTRPASPSGVTAHRCAGSAPETPAPRALPPPARPPSGPAPGPCGTAPPPTTRFPSACPPQGPPAVAPQYPPPAPASAQTAGRSSSGASASAAGEGDRVGARSQAEDLPCSSRCGCPTSSLSSGQSFQRIGSLVPSSPEPAMPAHGTVRHAHARGQLRQPRH